MVIDNKKGKENLNPNIFQSINDLSDKDFSGKPLSKDEKRALDNFNSYRLTILKAAQSKKDFHDRYKDLRIKAGLSPYSEFLKKPYDR